MDWIKRPSKPRLAAGCIMLSTSSLNSLLFSVGRMAGGYCLLVLA